MSENNFFSELKRRNVYKVAVAYAVVGWLIIQVATQVFPFLEIPTWVVRLVIAVVAIGFPIALIIAWAFELTPQGIKRTEDADRESARPSNRAWIYVAVIGAAVSVGLFFMGRYTAPRSGPAASTELPAKSIAVLPFDNLSRDPDNAYFTEGIQDEILTRLAKVAELKVISRTSTQRFKSSPEDLPQIAKQLGVVHILEGSVQRSGDSVRVNVQLINALTDAHLWPEIYDRKLTDIFAVESEIAKTIADALKAKLTGSEAHAIAQRPTANPEAHEFYLKGRYFWNKRTGADLTRAIEQFNAAIAKDPNYALAYAGLADAYVLEPAYSMAPSAQAMPPAKAAARKALELDPALGEAHASLGMALFIGDLDFAGSAAEFESAIALNPNYATAHHWFANTTLPALRQWDRMVAEGKRALELDPLSLIINADFGVNFMVARRYPEAIATLQKTLQLDPRFPYAHTLLGQALQCSGDLKGATVEYAKALELDPDDTGYRSYLAQAYARGNRRAEAEQILAELTAIAQTRYVGPYSFALIYLGLGDKEKATERLEQAYRERIGTDVGFIHVDPMLDDLRGYPRFEALVQKVAPKK
jgi:TolB-like protein/Tfp pilus assembly protein PilF